METQPEHKIAHRAEEKDLGVTIDDKMIFSRHIQIEVNKANSAVGLIIIIIIMYFYSASIQLPAQERFYE